MKISPTVGALGWLHESWLGQFYPEDMPLEWRLAFYANEFETVLVPQAQWLDLQASEMEDWIAEVGESFSFFLQCQLAHSRDISLMKTNLSHDIFDHEQIAGLVLTIDKDLKGVSQFLDEATSVLPVYLSDPDAELTPYADHGKVNPVWRYGQTSSVLGMGKTAIGLLSGSQLADDRELRLALESFSGFCGGSTTQAMLFFTDQELDMDLLGRAKIVSQLL